MNEQPKPRPEPGADKEHWRDYFKSNYLGSHHLRGKEPEVVIESIKQEGVFSLETMKDEDKMVIRFEGKELPFICNKTNADSIARIHGEDPRKWVGKLITLIAVHGKWFGDEGDAIRVKGKTAKSLRS